MFATSVRGEKVWHRAARLWQLGVSANFATQAQGEYSGSKSKNAEQALNFIIKNHETMKFIKNLFFLALAVSLATGFASCNKDDDDHDHHDNEITIRILEPMSNEKITDAAKVHIHIEVEASDENHEVEIVLYPHGDSSNKILDVDRHTHDKVFVFEQDIDLSSFPADTEFHLEVKACVDHDCKEKEEKHIDFSI
jgi:hypothetical protein